MFPVFIFRLKILILFVNNGNKRGRDDAASFFTNDDGYHQIGYDNHKPQNLR